MVFFFIEFHVSASVAGSVIFSVVSSCYNPSWSALLFVLWIHSFDTLPTVRSVQLSTLPIRIHKFINDPPTNVARGVRNWFLVFLKWLEIIDIGKDVNEDSWIYLKKQQLHYLTLNVNRKFFQLHLKLLYG